jgi:WD40 repeat protein
MEWHCNDGHDNMSTSMDYSGHSDDYICYPATVNASKIWANMKAVNGGWHFNDNYGLVMSGNYLVIMLMRTQQFGGMSTESIAKAHVWYQSPDYKICTENTFGLTLASTGTATVYTSDTSGIMVAQVNNDTTDTFEVPRETGGTSFLYIDCPAGCTLTNTSNEVCFGIDGGPACTTPGPATFSGTQKLKLTYPAT